MQEMAPKEGQMKIYIIGASGTGKSTLGSALSQKLNCPHLDSDDYYHYPTNPPFQKERTPEDRLSLLMTDLNKYSSWVLSGGAGVWEPAPVVNYSLVIFLYLPPKIRLDRLKYREEKLYGARIQSGGDMEIDHKNFMNWTRGYDDGTAVGTNTLPTHLFFVENLSCSILKFNKPISTEDQIEEIMTSLNIL